MSSISKRQFLNGFCHYTLASSALCALSSKAAQAEVGHENPILPQVTQKQHGTLTIFIMELGELAVNCYFVTDESRNCIVIDPGAESAIIMAFIKKHKFNINAWLLTHSHLDHISGLDECYALMPAPVAMHSEENDWAFCEKNQWEPHYPRTNEVPIARVLKHWQRSTDGAMRYTILHTPGHSPGSVCFWFPAEKIIFSGDTLFAGSVGRTDLHRSSAKMLLRSLGTFMALPPETVVYPGHGAATTVQREVKNNPFFND